MAPQFLQHAFLLVATLCIFVQKIFSHQNVVNEISWTDQNTKGGRFHLNHSLLGNLKESLKPLARFQRSPGNVSVVHLRLNDDDPYGIINYAGSVVLTLTYAVDGGGNVIRTRLYRGARYGEEMVNINGLLDSSDPNPVLSTDFYISDEDSRIVAFPHATLGQMYLSHDRGLTFEKIVFTPYTINPASLSWYPMDHNWILSLDNQNNNTLYVSNDTGISWTPIASNVAAFVWGDPSIDSPQTVYYSSYNYSEMMNGDLRVSLFKMHASNDDSGQLFDSSLGKFDSFFLTGHYIFVMSSSNGERTLQVSYKRQPFQVASFPMAHARRFYFLDISNIQAIAIVRNTSGQLNMYTSDSTGVNYTLSLCDLVHDSTSIDFNVIRGLNGVMVANQYVRSNSTQVNSPIRTVITYNNGGQWSLIKAPKVDLNGNPIPCVFPSCSLHLFMQTSAYWTVGVYTHKSALGLIASHGSLGQYLGTSPHLFMSRDGGFTWFESLQGSWVLTFMDHGGLIVAARDYYQNPSRYLKYSLDEGRHWYNFMFSSSVAVVFGAFTDPAEATADVCLFGVEDISFTWVVWNVNFSAVFSSQCTENDYYSWSPSDQTGGGACILGYDINVKRRLSNITCLNGPAFTPQVTKTNCSCSIEDYECAYGYQMQPALNNGSCVRDTAVVATCQPVSGYQKIPGDDCSGEFYIPPILCPDTATVSSSITAMFTSASTTHPTTSPTIELSTVINSVKSLTPIPTSGSSGAPLTPPVDTSKYMMRSTAPALHPSIAADEAQSSSKTATVTAVTIVVFAAMVLVVTVLVLGTFMLFRRLGRNDRTVRPSVAFKSDDEKLGVGNEYVDVHKDDTAKIVS